MLFTLERVILLFLITAVLASIIASAAEPSRAANAQRTYQNDRADCMSGREGPDKTACLREAGAALNEAKSGKLADPDTDFARNRVARCAYLTGPDKDYCLRRMNGEGTITGSVESGGILRELVVAVPASGDAAGRSN
ncbi:MAG TPA: hypothetical protein VKS43_09360 [Burkholderiales bacterium]|nr:hypothetical protein [Burkholderiales bacterium]